jgi:hypothetical protein
MLALGATLIDACVGVVGNETENHCKRSDTHHQCFQHTKTPNSQ